LAETPIARSQVTTAVAPGFEWHESAAGRVLQSSRLAALAPHVFTTRDRRFRDDTTTDDEARLAATLGMPPARVIRARQVHGRTVLVATSEDLSPDREADAIVTLDPTVAIAVRVADCVPILMADRHGRAVAAVHAGWRGACAGVVIAAVEALAERGVAPADLVVAIGPSIGACCYQVDDRVRNAFLACTPALRRSSGQALRRSAGQAASWFTADGPGHWRLDQWRANVDQLVSAGVPADAIAVSGVCTADHLDTCFSYRKEGPATGRMVAAIRIRT
jgi:YfiH family protein